MNAFRTMTLVEARLLVRDRLALVMSLALPAILTVVVGFALPGFREPAADLGGRRPIDVYLPVMLCLAIATVALSVMPVTLASYRERGVLRRLSTTPVPPRRIVGANLVVAGAATVAAIVIALVAAAIAHGTAFAENPVLALLGIVLGGTAMLAVGLLLAAVVPGASTANGLGMLLYFPMLFFAGVWTPGPLMPDGVERIQAFVPLGAAARVLDTAWSGGAFPGLELLVLVAYTAGLTALAARLFRWT